jgi:hypothetical protein
MFWKPRNLYELCLPIVVVWKYSFLPHYELEGRVNSTNRKFSHMKSKTYYLIIAFVISNTFLYSIIYKGVNKNFEDYTALYKLVATMLNNISVIVICHKCSDTFIKNVSTCVSVQRMLSQVNYKEFPVNEMAKTLLKISISKLCIMAAVTTNDLINTNFYSKVIAFNLEWYYSFFVELFLLYFLLVLKTLYSEFKNYVEQDKMCDLEASVAIYCCLTKASRQFNKSFERFILLRSFTDFAFIPVELSKIPRYDSDKEDIFQYVLQLAINYAWIPLILIIYFLAISYFENILQCVSFLILLIHTY